MTMDYGGVRVPIWDATPIWGGWHVQEIGESCIDVLMMAYNWRVALSTPEHRTIDAAYCYFGHGVDRDGNPRTMHQAFLRAMAAARLWDGTGDPLGYDKKAL